MPNHSGIIGLLHLCFGSPNQDQSGLDGFLRVLLAVGSFFLQEYLPGKLDPTAVIDIDDLDTDGVPDLDNVLDILDEAIIKFGNVTHAVRTWNKFDEGTEVLR